MNNFVRVVFLIYILCVWFDETKADDMLLEGLKKLENTIEDIRKNPVPIGFVYVQLSGQPDPKSLWSIVEWKDVTSDYAGLFFRAEGRGSEAFGKIQDENTPRLVEVQNLQDDEGAPLHKIQVSANNEWSQLMWTGGDTYQIKPDSKLIYGTQFKVSSGEVRPRNMAIRVWKRAK